MRRDGFSLIHCIVAMSVFAVLIVTVTSTLLTLSQIERHMRQQKLHASAVWRLSQQLRDDAHAACAADCKPANGDAAETGRLVLDMAASRQIEYRIEENRIFRIVREGEAIAHREAFEIPSRVAIRWELQPIDGHPVVSLLLARGLDGEMPEMSVAKNLRITAILGSDRRFLAKPTEGREQNDE